MAIVAIVMLMDAFLAELKNIMNVPTAGTRWWLSKEAGVCVQKGTWSTKPDFVKYARTVQTVTSWAVRHAKGRTVANALLVWTGIKQISSMVNACAHIHGKESIAKGTDHIASWKDASLVKWIKNTCASNARTHWWALKEAGASAQKVIPSAQKESAKRARTVQTVTSWAVWHVQDRTAVNALLVSIGMGRILSMESVCAVHGTLVSIAMVIAIGVWLMVVFLVKPKKKISVTSAKILQWA